MAQTKVSELSAKTSVGGSEELLINDAGTSKKITATNLLAGAVVGTGDITTAKLAADAVTNAKIADDSIDSEHYVDGSIDTAHIADNAITSAKLGVDVIVAEDIANNAITVAELADNAVTTAKINADAVTVDKLNLISTGSVPSLEAKGTSGVTDGYIQLNCAENSHGIKLKSPPHSAAASYTLTFPNNDGDANQVLTTDGSGVMTWASVGSNSITPGDVNTAALANDAVTGAKIADNAVDSEHYTDGSIDTAHIADSQITSAKIADGTIATGDIADDAVTEAKLANAINTAIAANTAKTSNATHTGEVTGSTTLTIADNVVDEANLKVSNSPSNGYVLTAQSGNTGGLTWAELSSTALGDNSVDSANYVDGSIDREHLAADIVDGTKIADDSINSEHYVDGSIDTAHIGDDQVTAAKLANSINTDIATGVTANTTANAALPKTGGTMTGQLSFGDNVHAKFGASDDLDIYHDASNSYIKDAGTGYLGILTSRLKVNNAADNEQIISATQDGSVDLFYNGSKKFETTNAGATVTGTLTADLANDSIDSRHYVNDSIDTAHYAAGSVDGTALASNSVTTAKINDGDVTTAKLAADCITAAKIGDNIINSEHYAADSIDNEHLAADCVTGAEIANDSLNSEHYVAGSIDNEHLAADCVGGSNIGDNVINSEHIAAGAVDLEHMSSQSVDEDNLYISNAGSNGQFLSKQSGNNGGLTWADAGGGTSHVFMATKNDGDQYYNNTTWTKITMTNEAVDTDGAYDATNSKFVVPSGEGGNYWFHTNLPAGNITANSDYRVSFYVNGSNSGSYANQNTVATGSYPTIVATRMFALSAGDYVELYFRSAGGGGRVFSNNETTWGGWKVS